jgi:hypothetical protein
MINVEIHFDKYHPTMDKGSLGPFLKQLLIFSHELEMLPPLVARN